jgi:hypothetical protein
MMERERLNRITESIIGAAKVGLLLNFNVQVLKQGIRRVVNNFPDSASSAVRL